MKKIKNLLTSSLLLLALPFLVSAGTAPTPSAPAQFDVSGGVFGDFLSNILVFINNVLIPFILGIGFLIFVWGMFQFFIAGGADEEKRNKGKSLIIWTILAFVIIIVFWGVINLIAGGTGIGGQSLDPVFIPQTVPEGVTTGATS